MKYKKDLEKIININVLRRKFSIDIFEHIRKWKNVKRNRFAANSENSNYLHGKKIGVGTNVIL